MEATGYSRKLDSMGRLVIPTKLRDRMGLVTGQNYSFYTTEDENGKRYICIECPGVSREAMEEVQRILQKYGVNIGQNDN